MYIARNEMPEHIDFLTAGKPYKVLSMMEADSYKSYNIRDDERVIICVRNTYGWKEVENNP